MVPTDTLDAYHARRLEAYITWNPLELGYWQERYVLAVLADVAHGITSGRVSTYQDAASIARASIYGTFGMSDAGLFHDGPSGQTVGDYALSIIRRLFA